MSDDEMDDELRHLLGRLDPSPDRVAMEEPTSPSARQRLEYIMTTNTSPSAHKTAPSPRRRPAWMAGVGAAAAAAAIVVGIAVFTGGGDGEPTTAATPPLVLELGESNALASCIAPSADMMRTMSPAFAGTVTAVEGETVTLQVDTWYAGGDAATVALEAPAGLEALIGGIDFRVGEQYFITAANGVVNYCGFSGPLSDPGLAALVAEAFGS